VLHTPGIGFNFRATILLPKRSPQNQSTMEKSPKISIILPVHEDQKGLSSRLEELQRQEKEPLWELVVVDDGSPVALTLGPEPAPHWALIRNETRQGAAVSRNRGAELATGEYLVFLSAFLEIPKDYVQQVMSFVDSNRPVYAQHPISLSPNLKLNHFQRFVGSHDLRVDDQGGELSIKQSLFTAALIKTDIFRELGGFDETMQHYGGHEMDLIYRLSQAGHDQRLLIQTCPLHRTAVSTHEGIQARLREYGRIGLPNLLKKHPDLKGDILIYPLLWSTLRFFGLTGYWEKRLGNRIENNRQLATSTYRLYLHLLMRNAWDAR